MFAYGYFIFFFLFLLIENTLLFEHELVNIFFLDICNTFFKFQQDFFFFFELLGKTSEFLRIPSYVCRFCVINKKVKFFLNSVF